MPTKLLLSRAKLLLSYYRRPLSPTHCAPAGSGLPARAYPPRPPSLQLRLLVLVLVLVLILHVALLLLALVVGLDAVALHHLELGGDLAQARLDSTQDPNSC